MTAWELTQRLFALNDQVGMSQFTAVERLKQYERVVALVHQALAEDGSHLALATAELTTTAGQAYVDLPADFWAMENPEKSVYLPLYSRDLPLEAVRSFRNSFRLSGGVPEACYIRQWRLYLGPIPDQVYALILDYLTTPPALTYGTSSADDAVGAETILRANDTPWRGLFDQVLIPWLERLLLQREEYDTSDLIPELQRSSGSAMAIQRRNQHAQARDSRAAREYWRDLGL